MFKENVCVGGKHFFHLTDISIVKSFILFRLHQTNNPDNTKLKRKAGYSLGDIREEVISGLCGFPEYGDPPASIAVRPPSGPPPPQELEKFVTDHIPVHAKERRTCVVCQKEGRGKVYVQSYCSAPQCKEQFMHVAKEQNCFATFHSIEYQRNNP